MFACRRRSSSPGLACLGEFVRPPATRLSLAVPRREAKDVRLRGIPMRFSSYLPLLLLPSLLAQPAAVPAPRRPSPAAIHQWQARKFGLFIHFGLYSELGGIWKGERIEGYNEQIRLHAHIAKDEYGCRRQNSSTLRSGIPRRSLNWRGMRA